MKESELAAMEVSALNNTRVNHMRDIVGGFLNRTRVLHLERDLVDFLIDIDRRHREEVKELNLIVQSLSHNKGG